MILTPIWFGRMMVGAVQVVRSRWLLMALMATGVVAARPASADDNGTKLPVAEIEKIVHDYLLKNPEVVYDAIQELQKRQAAQEAERQRSMIVSQSKQIFEDPADPVAGDPASKVAMVEFFDYHCGYCRAMQPSLEGMMNTESKVRFVFKEFPILGPGLDHGGQGGARVQAPGPLSRDARGADARQGPLHARRHAGRQDARPRYRPSRQGHGEPRGAGRHQPEPGLWRRRSGSTARRASSSATSSSPVPCRWRSWPSSSTSSAPRSERQDVPLKLYDHWNSSSAYRIRIALGLKRLTYERIVINRLRGVEEPAYRAVNPQGFVPVLDDNGLVILQSSAILDHLEERFPEPPLLPGDAAGRARVRALAAIVVSDIQPLNNQRVQDALTGELGLDEEALRRWYRRWIDEGFGAIEALLAGSPATGRFCHGNRPTLADVCLVPQVYNARRWRCDLDPYPRIRRIEAACLALEAFDAARPERQSDADDEPPPVIASGMTKGVSSLKRSRTLVVSRKMLLSKPFHASEPA